MFNYVNEMRNDKSGCNVKGMIFKPILWIDIWGAFCKIVARRMLQNSTDDKSTSVQVMAWCRQASSHYLSQCCSKQSPKQLFIYAAIWCHLATVS